LVGEDYSIIINLTNELCAFENYSMKACPKTASKYGSEKEISDLILMDLVNHVLDGVRYAARCSELWLILLNLTSNYCYSGNINNYTYDYPQSSDSVNFIQKTLDFEQPSAALQEIPQLIHGHKVH